MKINHILNLKIKINLRREGHGVVVFEQVGGTWVYTPELDSEPQGLDPKRSIVHSSLYASLRTNLPRECMGFRDYPFAKREGKGRDSRRFPSHREDFAAEFEIGELVRFGTGCVCCSFIKIQKDLDQGNNSTMSEHHQGVIQKISGNLQKDVRAVKGQTVEANACAAI
ncbi:putative flavin-containing monooxygenase FMO GS-OX-like 11 [Glycine max]|nr:putative flavin-containing monooxygenase FMO GS-OX-like 11 [Glycine max]